MNKLGKNIDPYKLSFRNLEIPKKIGEIILTEKSAQVR
jgi:hypothetical protein